MPSTPLQQLRGIRQQVWLDSIRRSYLDPGGYLERLINSGEIDGLTSNPTIFQKAIGTDPAYGDQLDMLQGADPREALWTLMKDDVRRACDLFLPLYQRTGRRRGFVSIEVDPTRAFEEEATVDEARKLAHDIDRPNLMVKVPGTEPGLPALTRLVGEGINVNVTLLFSVDRYVQVTAAYRQGLERFLVDGGRPSAVASVASFFVSRVDGKVDAKLAEDDPLRGRVAIANARVAYARYQQEQWSERMTELLDLGANPQWPLWASTSTKDPRYSDVLYVEELAGPNTVNTMPEATLDAFRQHGTVADRLSGQGEEAEALLALLPSRGIDLPQITKELEIEGVDAFIDSLEAAVRAVAEAIG